MHGTYGWHMGGMWLWSILVVIALAVMVWLVISSLRHSTIGSGESPEQALKRRFANGEIDREEYNRALSELKK